MKKIILLLFLFSNLIYSQFFSELNSGTTSSLISGVSTVGYPNYTWICGSNGTIIKTTNNGFTWVNRNYGLPGTINFNTIDARDSSNAVVAGSDGAAAYVYRTTNGGMNWVQVLIQSNGYINSIFFKKALLGFMSGNPVGGRWSLWKTTNGGATWDSAGLRLPQAGAETGFNNSMWVKKDSIWIGTNNNKIYYSSNYGLTWSVESTGGLQNVRSIFFGSPPSFPGEGYAGGDSLKKTTNYGFNWASTVSGGTGNIVGIAEGNPGVYENLIAGIFMARGTQIAYQIFTNPWAYYNPPSGSYNYLFKPRYRDSTTFEAYGSLFGIRNNGGISVCGCTFGSVRRLGNEIPINFNLSQNYPNPFNPITKIRFDVPSAGFQDTEPVRLIIYDVLGRQAEELVNQKLTPGTYEVDWDASNFSSGVYFYSLQTRKFTNTKKMILTK